MISSSFLRQALREYSDRSYLSGLHHKSIQRCKSNDGIRRVHINAYMLQNVVLFVSVLQIDE
jgi:hypothetical protein